MSTSTSARTTVSSTSAKDTEVKSAARTLEVLELLAGQPRPLTLTEIATRLPLPLSSLHQLLKTLVSRGWLDSTHGGGYTIGVRALLTGMSFIDRDPVVQVARSVLNVLRSDLGETVHLARLDGARMIYLVSRESEHQLRTVSRVGQSLSAHATALGKAALATRTDEQVRSLFVDPLERLTVKTIATVDELVVDLGRTRARGWAEEHEENTAGSACVGVVIPGAEGPYAISCSVPLTRLTTGRLDDAANALLAAAREIGAALRPIGLS